MQKFAPMSKAEIRQLKVLPIVVAAIAKSADRSDLFRTCLTCANFDEVPEHCKLVNVRPPARVIADGCDKYLDVFYDVPF